MVMSALVSRYRIEKAEADGNCAFNAFALVLCTGNVLSKLSLSDDSQFVVKASQLLNVNPATWPALRKVLTSPSISKIELQTTLAPLLRALSIETVTSNPNENQKHSEATLAPLVVEFSNYLSLKNDPLNPPLNYNNIGDIFYRHGNIRDKFSELQQRLASSSEAALSDELTSWWRSAGHAKFMNNMRQPKVFAGDMELAQLGKYFGINIFIESRARKMHNVQIHHANGTLTPTLELVPGLRSELANRHIAEADNTWIVISQDDLIKRLSAVPQLVEVEALLATAPRINTRIPDHIDPKTRDELLVRGLIDKTRTLFAMNIDPGFAIPRIRELPQKDLVVKEWNKSYVESPAIFLQNESAVHWNAIHEFRNPVPLPTPNDPKPLVMYQVVEGEKDVNDAINKIYDALNGGNPPLDDKVIKENFEKAFDELSIVLKNFQEKKIDFGLFKQKKEEIVAEVQQNVLTHKI